MSSIRTLVTGGGSIVGQGIIKALRHSRMPVTIICTDIAPLNAGLYRADEAAVLPAVESEGALEAWIQAIRKLRAEVLMIGSEFDLAFFSMHRERIEKKTGCTVIASPPEVVAIADDKLRTADFLRAHGLPFARSVAVSTLADAQRMVSELGFPVVLKSRSGTSARNVHVIEDAESLAYWFPRMPAPMVQEYLKEVDGGLGSEFTCSAFRCKDGTILGPFVSRRTLRGGSSWMVEVAPSEDIGALTLAIARQLPSVGSLNVQLRATERGPVPFELNARFSGTTPIRAHFGFNEPAMAIRSYRLDQAIQPPAIGSGFCMRYVEELLFSDPPALTLEGRLPAGVVNRWF